MNNQMKQYALDLDRRGLIEKAMYGGNNSQKKNQKAPKTEISKKQALKVIKYL